MERRNGLLERYLEETRDASAITDPSSTEVPSESKKVWKLVTLPGKHLQFMLQCSEAEERGELDTFLEESRSPFALIPRLLRKQNRG